MFLSILLLIPRMPITGQSLPQRFMRASCRLRSNQNPYLVLPWLVRCGTAFQGTSTRLSHHSAVPRINSLPAPPSDTGKRDRRTTCDHGSRSSCSVISQAQTLRRGTRCIMRQRLCNPRIPVPLAHLGSEEAARMDHLVGTSLPSPCVV